jgi:two-component sensor histidine kinase
VRLELFSRGNVLPAGFGPNQRSGGLGLQLIRTLVEKDLGGNFTLDSREDGVAGVIYFVPEKG